MKKQKAAAISIANLIARETQGKLSVPTGTGSEYAYIVCDVSRIGYDEEILSGARDRAEHELEIAGFRKHNFDLTREDHEKGYRQFTREDGCLVTFKGPEEVRERWWLFVQIVSENPLFPKGKLEVRDGRA